MDRLKNQFTQILAKAGITVNGRAPFDISVHNERFYGKVLRGYTLALGESYMDGWWDCPRLDLFFEKVLRARLDEDPSIRKNPGFYLNLLLARTMNLQTKARAAKAIHSHYDIGNDLYEAMLDKRMTYTCAKFEDGMNLDQAQENKLDLVCRKLHLKPGQHVLDIGCGWGSFAKFAAEKYGVSVVGVTISSEQIALGNELCKGLPVKLRMQDYRDVREKFDHIVSLGMFEHVGYKNYRTYMEVTNRLLKDDGLLLLHTIGGNKISNSPDPWMDKYIFPNGTLPSLQQIAIAAEGIFVQEDMQNFGPDYNKTLLAWNANFENALPALDKKKYDIRFQRMWNYYLLSCAGAFAARDIELWQFVFSKRGRSGTYLSVR